MPKNLLQDMIKVKRTRRQVLSPQKEAEINLPKRDTNLPLLVKTKDKNGKSKYTLWGVAIVSFIFFLFAVSYLFVSATVKVNPKVKDVVLNENLSANRDGGDADLIPFDLIVISGEENKMVPTTGEEEVSENAKGVVVIYNAFGSASQKLSIDTRLTGSNGKIYKTNKAIVVPGMKDGTPGSVEVGIYGAVAGEEYNSSPLDFTILGFKGTPKYSKFYARSKGSITSGFKGKASIIPEAQKQNTINALKATLQAKLFKKATDQIPSGFLLFKDAVFLEIDDNSTDFISSASSKDNTLPVKISGTLYGFLFDEVKLTKKIAKDNIKNYDDSLVYIPNIQNLTFSLPNKESISFADVKNIDFNLKGAAKIVWKLDEVKLIADLLGKSKKDFNQILSQYPNIESANLSIVPFWKSSFPDKSKDIKVIVNYPK